MLLSSLSFLFIFLPITLFLYYLSDKKYKNIILLVASLVFYAYLGIKYLFILGISILINYIGAFLICRIKGKINSSKIILIITILSNIVLLGYYKYMNFFVENLNVIFSSNITISKIIMPIGISFYTFKGISYVVDVYRDNSIFKKNPLNVAIYMSLFPQITAGPISRYLDINKQIIEKKVSIAKFEEGIKRFIFGIGKKVIISNTFASIADSIFVLKIANVNFGLAWIGILAYTLQIYFDFSGYSDMAIGVGKMFGFDFLENFNYPYISKSITEFWRRWHISLSSWFKDYVYIPLGGNRVSVFRHIINTFAVWLLTGFWHGSSWSFIAWGVYYGVIIILEKYIYGKLLNKLPDFIKHIYSILLIMVGWVFFRSSNLEYALQYIGVMFSFNINKLSYITIVRYLIEYKFEWIIAIIACTPIYKYTDRFKNKSIFTNIERVLLLLLFFVSIVYVVASTYNSFIYFQF
jgi:alginate O-acetyltransferase complex protein AlgI